MKTVLYELKAHLQKEVDLSFMKQQNAVDKEKKQVEDAHMAGQKDAGVSHPSYHSALNYFKNS